MRIRKRIIFNLALSAFIIIWLFRYVKPIPDESVSYLSYGIYGLGVLALLIFYGQLYRIKLEWDCAVKARKGAIDIFLDIKNNDLEYNLENITSLGNTKYFLSTNRIIDHIRTEAQSRRFDSSLTILNAYKEEFMSQYIRIASFQKIALQLGILGTFIGLSKAFSTIHTGNLDFGALIASLKLPFSTSIAARRITR